MAYSGHLYLTSVLQPYIESVLNVSLPSNLSFYTFGGYADAVTCINFEKVNHKSYMANQTENLNKWLQLNKVSDQGRRFFAEKMLSKILTQVNFSDTQFILYSGHDQTVSWIWDYLGFDFYKIPFSS